MWRAAGLRTEVQGHLRCAQHYVPPGSPTTLYYNRPTTQTYVAQSFYLHELSGTRREMFTVAKVEKIMIFQLNL